MARAGDALRDRRVQETNRLRAVRTAGVPGAAISHLSNPCYSVLLEASGKHEHAPSGEADEVAPNLPGWLRALALFELTLGAFALLVGGHGVRHYLTTEPTHQWHAMRLWENLVWDLRDVGIGVALVFSGVLLWKGHKWPQLFTLAGVPLLWIVAATVNR